MVGTICPMVHGAGTKFEKVRVLLMYTCGSLVGAATMGAVIAGCGSFFLLRLIQYKQLPPFLLAIVSVFYLFDEFRLLKLPHPQLPLRVPADWRFLDHGLAAGLYGLVLGMGIWTAIPFSVFYVAIGWCFLIGSPALGMISFLGFGVGRALPILILTKLDTPELIDSVYLNIRFVGFLNQCALAFAGTSLFLSAIS